MQALQLLGGLSASEFLAQYWHKRPLLIRQAIPGYRSPVCGDELAGLALEPEVESRLLLEKDGESPWQLEHGPFAAERFADLPPSHWTLLIQEINKHVPEFALLQERFNFIPNWRLDDVMVSYAPEAGSVGPHADNYDVFLLQGQGRRRWGINTVTPSAEDLEPGLPLRILKQFEAEQEWILEPGDMLYLPPGVAHHGVALEECITVSIGFRAPNHIELFAAFAHSVIAGLDEEGFYADPDLTAQSNPGAISERARATIREFLRNTVRDDEKLDDWFGHFITAPRPGHHIPEPPRDLRADEFRTMLEAQGELWRSEYCRFAYIAGEPVRLFVGGEEYSLEGPAAFAAEWLCASRRWDVDTLAPHLERDDFLQLLTRLYNQGCLYFPEDE